MKIHRRDLTPSQVKAVEAAIGELEADQSGRVCGTDCNFVCKTCGSVSCRCHCNVNCPDIPAQLSSDPEKYPVEEVIAPLAFELKRLGVFEPCWSCEGHNGLDGKLWKRPAVWFFCDRVTYLRLLADAVEGLYTASKLNHQWRIRTTYSESDTPDSVFSLEPDKYDLGEAKLENLHADIGVLAENIFVLVHEHADRVKGTL